MKSFMFLFRGGLDPEKASPEEMQQNMEKWFGWVNDLRDKGVYTAGEALLPSGLTLQKNNVVTDGPFAESKEVVGGFFIIKAESIEAATEVAKGCPDLSHGGTVEIRDVMVFDEGMM
jgi:hypothetical protein